MMLIFCQQIKTEVFNKMIVSLSMCATRHAQSTKRNKFTISLQYLKKNVKDVNVFFKVILSFYVCVAKHAQITQNNKPAISLKHVKKGVMQLTF